MQIEPADPHASGAFDLGIDEGHAADEIGDKRGRRMPVNLGRRADLIDDALVHHHDAVGHRHRFFLVVRDHDGGDAEPALQILDLVAQPQPHARIERGERLIEQEQPGDVASARASATRCCCPPDSWTGYLVS